MELTYFNRAIAPPLVGQSAWEKVSCVFKNRLLSRNHLPVLKDSNLGESYNPIVFSTCNRMKQPSFVYVYGYRKNVYIKIKDNFNQKMWEEDSEVLSNLRKIMNSQYEDGKSKIFDLKLVYKTPNISACLGEKLMLKLYVSDFFNVTVFKEKMRKVQHSLFNQLDFFHVYDSNITKDTILYNKLYLMPNGKMFLHKYESMAKKGKCMEYFVHYSDVSFHEREEELFNRDVTCEDLISQIKDTAVIQIFEKRRELWSDSRDYTEIKRMIKKIFDTKCLKIDLKYRIKRCQQIVMRFVKGLRQDSLAKLEKKYQEISRSIALQKKWAVCDIETDHENLIDKEETVLMISCSIFDHSKEDCLTSMVFTRLPDMCDKIDRDVLKEYGMDQFGEIFEDFPHLRDSLGLKICRDEFHLLREFSEFVKKLNLSYLGSFNGFRFDLPFLDNRWRILQARKEKDKNKEDRFLFQNRRLLDFFYPLTLLPDKCCIKYAENFKQSAFKTKAIESFREKALKRKRKDSEDSDNDSDDDDYLQNHSSSFSVRSESKQNLVSSNSNKFQNFLKYAKNIQNINANFIVLVDVMHLVCDNKARGISLNAACEKFNLRKKIEDEDVSYTKMFATWSSGFKDKLCKLIMYCLVDTLLLVKIIKITETNTYNTILGEMIGLSESVIYSGESVKKLTSVSKRFGYRENLITSDTTNVRNEHLVWKLDRKWNEKDYVNLKPSGGSTMACLGYFQNPSVTMDAKACYPTIMIIDNPCLSSFLDIKDIEKHKFKENIDYTTFELENVAPLNKHVCLEERGWCPLERENIDTSIKCIVSMSSQRVTKKVYYISKSRYRSILCRVAENFGNLRQDYQAKKKQSSKKGDHIKAMVYDQCQKVCKIMNNALYGASCRISPLVGETITYIARYQARKLSNLGWEKGMYTINGDTDSVFLSFSKKPDFFTNFSVLAQNMNLDPKEVSIPQVIKKMKNMCQHFADEVNGKIPGIPPMFDSPYTLEFEKIFLQTINVKKKSYFGDKIEPDSASIKTHMAGITGKKADTSQIKSKCQLIAFYMLLDRDVLGMIDYLWDMYDVCSWFLYLYEKKEAKIWDLYRKADKNNKSQIAPQVKILEDNFQRECEKYFKKFEMDLFLSRETVGDLSKMKTLASKKAVRDCEIRGDNQQTIGKTLDMCRNSKVQLETNICNIVDLLIFNTDYEKHANLLKMLESKEIYTRKKKVENNVITKFDITTIPVDKHADKKFRYQLSPREITGLLCLKKHIQIREKNIETSIKKDLEILLPPDKLQNEEKLFDFISNYSLKARQAPIAACVEGEIASQIEQCSETVFITKHLCLDVWSALQQVPNSVFSHEFINITVEKDKFRLEFGNQRGKHHLEPKSVILSQPTEIFEGDVISLHLESYLKQTNVTPVLCASYSGENIFLYHRYSYNNFAQNLVHFAIERQYLERLKPAGLENVHVCLIPGSSQVLMGNNVADVKILRNDGRKTEMWPVFCAQGFILQMEHVYAVLKKFVHEPILNIHFVDNELIVYDDVCSKIYSFRENKSNFTCLLQMEEKISLTKKRKKTAEKNQSLMTCFFLPS